MESKSTNDQYSIKSTGELLDNLFSMVSDYVKQENQEVITMDKYTYNDIAELIKANTIRHPKMKNCKTSSPSWYGALTKLSKGDSEIQFGFSYPFEEPMMKLTTGYELGMFYIDHETESLKFLSPIKKYQKLLPEDKSIRLDKHINIKFNDDIESMLAEALERKE